MTTPSEVNQLPDEVLAERVVLVSKDPSANSRLEAVVPFATYGLVFRIHEKVAKLNNAKQLVWNKQATVGRVLGSVVGVGVQHNVKEWEYIGNAVDARLRHYCKDLAKARDADRQRRRLKSKRGEDPSLNFESESRVAALEQRLYVCEYGGTPLKVPIVEDEKLPCRQLSIKKQPVPYRASGVAEVLKECELVRKSQVTAAANDGSRLRSLERDAYHAIREFDRARERLQSLGEDAMVAASILQVAAVEARQQVEESRERVQKAERARVEQECKVLRLEGHLVQALRLLEQEHAQRKVIEEDAERDLSSVRAEVDAARCEAHECKERVKEAKLLCEKKEGEVLFMEGKLVRAWQETYSQQQRGADIVEQHQAELDEVRASMDALKGELQVCKEKVHTLEAEANVKNGKLLHIEGKLGQSLQDTARAQENARNAKAAFESERDGLKKQLAQLEKDLEHAKELKNAMAKRVREVRQKEENAEQTERDLHKLRLRVRELNKKEVTTLRSQLCVEEQPSSSSAEEAGSSTADEEEAVAESRKVAESREAAEALQKIKEMPSWRAVRGRGKGKGAAKYEWGVRLVIYSLLALMVPASAVGMVVVMIVKYTAPWLKPTAPTCETVQRCRFELRFFEEALAARRVASAYRIRSIGFDETTKLGNSSMTSNVQIEPTQGAKLEDVILRAAYCPLGGTAEMCVETIERKCFSRLRELLRRWKQKFEEMYPNEEWTGPDPSLCSLHRLGGGGAIISDTCSTARKSRRLLADLIAKQRSRWKRSSAQTHGMQ